MNAAQNEEIPVPPWSSVGIFAATTTLARSRVIYNTIPYMFFMIALPTVVGWLETWKFATKVILSIVVVLNLVLARV